REYAERAADRATATLALDAAAALYQEALETAAPERRQVVRRKLADALANAGRGPEAAAVYIAASEGAPRAEALELRRLAAEQLLRAGQIDAGLDVLAGVLDSIGARIPETPGRALRSLVLRRVELRLRGLDFEQRDTTQVSAEELTKIDAHWSAAVGL